MKAFIVTVASVFFAGAAAAQDQRDVNVNIGASGAANCNFLDARYFGCGLARSAAAKRHEQLKRDVGQLIAQGRCDEAFKMALDAGEFDMARESKGLCTPAATPAAP